MQVARDARALGRQRALLLGVLAFADFDLLLRSLAFIGVPFFIVTHRPHDPHAEDEFTFVNGLDEALAQARQAAGDKDVSIMGGADVIRQALRAGHIEELTISIAPVVLGGGKRLFEGFDLSLDLERERVRQSPLATHITYRIKR